jgi:hypothetical protein
VSNHQHYVGRAEECCANFSDARSAAEKQVWLSIAESWLMLARHTSDLPLQGLAQSVVQSGRENRAGERPTITTETAPEVITKTLAESDAQKLSDSGADLPFPIPLHANSLRSWATRSNSPDSARTNVAAKLHPG